MEKQKTESMNLAKDSDQKKKWKIHLNRKKKWKNENMNLTRDSNQSEILTKHWAKKKNIFFGFLLIFCCYFGTDVMRK